ncbi:MAG: feruloyl-CoA synthase [Xanthobacteraceae bacterium]
MAQGVAEQRQAGAAKPVRRVRFGPSDVVVDHKPNGTFYLRSPHPLAEYPPNLMQRLDHWAAESPQRILFAERDRAGSWRSITYAQALDHVRSLGQVLLDADLSPDRPLVILSGNDIEHALLGLAALYVGIPYAPISPAYSLISTDFAKLRHIIHLLTPGLVFAADGESFGRAIERVMPPDVDVIVTRNQLAGARTIAFSTLLERPATSAVDAMHANVGPDTIAKFLFTSGSTGQPKGVINTHRMLSSNQVMIRTSLAFMQDEPPVLVDWAPWHHTAGGNHNVGLVLYNGGSFYIDGGKPTPNGIDATVRNLREIAPTWYFNVPKGYEALLPHLRADKGLRDTFFSRLKALFYAGAGLSQHVMDELGDLAWQACGEQILFLTSLGATETGPFALVRTWDSDMANNIGLPASGLELKLAPLEGKLEARLRGPNITPGYWRQADLTANAFDDEGFYRLGDALQFADPADPRKGLLFAGRIAEDFKLATGTWVNVGTLRTKFIDHCAPYVVDVVIAGADQNEIAALIVPNVVACRGLCPQLPPDVEPMDVLGDPRVQGRFQALLDAFARESTGSSNRISRVILLEEPLSLDAGEVTDKGSLNQRVVLQNRRHLIDELYGAEPSPRVIIAGARPSQA